MKQHKTSCFGIILSCDKYLNTRAEKQNTADLPMPYRYFVGDGVKSIRGDVVGLKCPDNYESLHYKVYESIKWVDSNTEYDYILKTDDDIIFNRSNIEKIYKKIIESECDYCGNFTLVQNGYMSDWHFGKCYDKIINKTHILCPKTYYASGGAYFLSRKFVKQYLNIFPTLNKNLIYEDAFMGVAFNECKKIDNSLKILDGVNRDILEAFNWI